MKMLSRTTATLGVAGLVTAGLAAATPANAAGSIFQIKVTEVETSSSDTMHGAPEVGDTFFFTSNLRQDGERVGKDAGKCTIKRLFGPSNHPTSGDVRCVATLHFFTKGTIRVAGTNRVHFNDDPEDFTVRVKDGSGAYEGVGGTMRVHQVSDTKSRLTINLTNYHP